MPSIQQHPIGQCGFWGQLYNPLWFVVHFTGGTPNLQSLYDYWVSQCNIGSNSHYGIERYSTGNSQPGDIWQFLPLTGGAAANCCLEGGHAPFLPNENLNVRTVSVENINADSGNNGAMPQAQFDSLVYLIKTVCQEMSIPTDRYTEYWNGYETTHTWGDAGGGVIMHRDIAPQSRRMCPGEPYYNGQMDAIMKAVNGAVSPPRGWNANMEKQFMDLWMSAAGVNPDGTTWKAFNSGLCQFCLSKFKNNIMPGATKPTSGEVTTVDWGGKPILMQTLANGMTVVMWKADSSMALFDINNKGI